MASAILPPPSADETGAILLAELLSEPGPAADVVARGAEVVRAIQVRWLVPQRHDPASKPPAVHEIMAAGRILVRGPFVLLNWVRRPRGASSPDARPPLLA